MFDCSHTDFNVDHALLLIEYSPIIVADNFYLLDMVLKNYKITKKKVINEQRYH